MKEILINFLLRMKCMDLLLSEMTSLLLMIEVDEVGEVVFLVLVVEGFVENLIDLDLLFHTE